MEEQTPVSLPDGSEIVQLGQPITNAECKHEVMIPDWSDQLGEQVAANCASCNWGTFVKVSSL